MPSRTRACAVCVHQGKMLMVRLEDPQTKRLYLFPPGGQVEPGETPAQAACRETLEETGYAVEIDESSDRLALYPFEWGGKLYDCRTHFFRARLASAEAKAVSDAAYHRGVEWIPVAAVAAEFAYLPALRDPILALL